MSSPRRSTELVGRALDCIIRRAVSSVAVAWLLVSCVPQDRPDGSDAALAESGDAVAPSALDMGVHRYDATTGCDATAGCDATTGRDGTPDDGSSRASDAAVADAPTPPPGHWPGPCAAQVFVLERPFQWVTYDYDEEGRLTEVRRGRASDERADWTQRFRYGMDGRVVARFVDYNYDGAVDEIFRYGYLGSDLASIVLTDQPSGGVRTEWRYAYEDTPDGRRVIEETFRPPNPVVVQRVVFVLNRRGAVLFKQGDYFADGTVDFRITYHYAGDLLSREEFDWRADGSVEDVVAYEYDDAWNLILKREIYERRPEMTWTYSYECWL